MEIAQQLILLDMVIHEARRRSKKRYPSVRFLAEVLADIGFRIVVR